MVLGAHMVAGTEEDEEVVEEVVHRHPHHSLVPSRDVDDELIL
jgi:16S rRNA C967 or C1407 C5-methylase (RsmB/RsmF family)